MNFNFWKMKMGKRYQRLGTYLTLFSKNLIFTTVVEKKFWTEQSHCWMENMCTVRRSLPKVFNLDQVNNWFSSHDLSPATLLIWCTSVIKVNMNWEQRFCLVLFNWGILRKVNVYKMEKNMPTSDFFSHKFGPQLLGCVHFCLLFGFDKVWSDN